MDASKNAYTLRFETSSVARITRDEAMHLARSQGISLRELILRALVRERERLGEATPADEGPLTDAQTASLRAQYPESYFAGEEPLGSPLW